MEAVLADAPSVVGLEVIEQNEPAIRLYESLGLRTHPPPRGVVADSGRAGGRRARRGAVAGG